MLTKPIFSLTCSAPTLLRDRARKRYGGTAKPKGESRNKWPGQGTRRVAADAFLARTGRICVWEPHSRYLVTVFSPLQVRISEFEETRELFVGSLSGAKDGRHAGVHRLALLIR